MHLSIIGRTILIVSMTFVLAESAIVMKAGDNSTIKILHQGTLLCEPKDEPKKSETCELSTASVIATTGSDKTYVLSTNDKDTKMQVFKTEDLIKKSDGFSKGIAPLRAQNMDINKIEAVSNNHGVGLAVGSYIKPNEPNYCKIVSFNVNPEGHIVNTKQVAGPEFWNKIAQAFEKANKKVPEYFKIEAAKILDGVVDGKPKMELVIGVREHGQDFKVFDYSVLMFGVDLTLDNEKKQYSMGDTIRFIRDDSAKMKDYGISDLTYNRKEKKLLLLTSIEIGNKQSGSLWYMDYDDKKDDLAKGEFKKIDTGAIFEGHKPEGLTWIDNQDILVIADEDRAITDLADGTKRSVQESPFWVLSLGGDSSSVSALVPSSPQVLFILSMFALVCSRIFGS